MNCLLYDSHLLPLLFFFLPKAVSVFSKRAVRTCLIIWLAPRAGKIKRIPLCSRKKGKAGLRNFWETFFFTRNFFFYKKKFSAVFTAMESKNTAVVRVSSRVWRIYFATKTVQPFGHIISPLLIKLVRSRWLDIGLVLFFA